MLGRERKQPIYFELCYFYREALNILRSEHVDKKRYEQEQRRWMMMQKVAELRQMKHTQIVHYQQNYFQHLLDEEQKK